MEPVNDKNIQYERAKKVKEIQRFLYSRFGFCFGSTCFNLSISIKYDSFETFFQQNHLGNRTLGNWTFAHGLSVFLFNFILEKLKKRKSVN